MHEILGLFELENCRISEAPVHEGGRNRVLICEKEDGTKYVLRISSLKDRMLSDYLAETEYVRYLAQNGAWVSDVVPSVNGRLVESMETEDGVIYCSLFEYAIGDSIADHGYQYIEGRPLKQYYLDTGKALGKIHALSKRYVPKHRRRDYSDKFNRTYIDRLIPVEYKALKAGLFETLNKLSALEKTADNYGLVHFDFSDGNYHVDYTNGNITTFDFDNACYCWYMYDLANLWIHGEGWLYGIKNDKECDIAMRDYFSAILAGYRSETDISENELSSLPLFIDLVLVENIVDEFETALRAGEAVDPEDIESKARLLINGIPYAGIVSSHYEHPAT